MKRLSRKGYQKVNDEIGLTEKGIHKTTLLKYLQLGYAYAEYQRKNETN